MSLTFTFKQVETKYSKAIWLGSHIKPQQKNMTSNILMELNSSSQVTRADLVRI